MKFLKKYFDDFTETLPPEILKKYGFLSRKEALLKIHFPQNQHDIDLAKHRLAYEELYEINFKAISKKYEHFSRSE